jgi:CubicO group peptidase (beta-lactamase class C family)
VRVNQYLAPGIQLLGEHGEGSMKVLADPLRVGGAVAFVVAVAAAQLGAQLPAHERIARVERGLLPHVVPKGQAGTLSSIAERMAYHGIPGISLAVIENGQIAWARAYGVRERDGDAPVTTETLFQGASLSKPVTAFGALLLVQQRPLDLDRDVSQWMRSWNPGAPITLRQLLSHTAGLGVAGFSGYAPGTPLPTTTQILTGERPANNEAVRVIMPPGKEVRYSGGGYVVVQQLLMDETKLTFDEYMRRAVFAPLGMTHSSFRQPLSAEEERAAAAGHRRDGSKLRGNSMVYPELAAAGLWTTPTDLALMMIELQDALAARPTRVLKAQAAREMLTGRRDNAGLGFFLTGPNGASRRFTHSGRNAGFDARLVGYKNGRQGAVVMINRNNNEGFIDEVLESVARAYGWPDFVPSAPQREYEAIPSSVQSSYAGVYEAGDRPVLTVIFEDGKLFGRSGHAAWLRLYPASATEFFERDSATRWTFLKGADGVMEVVARSGGIEIRRRRRQ